MKIRVLASFIFLIAAVYAQTPRTVRISFLPPPIEGTISLGIYDHSGKLVRVLQREAEIAEFEIGADALHTTWDGNDDAGAPLPAGKYSARGFVVGDLRVDEAGSISREALATSAKVTVRLTANPLTPGKKPSIDLIAAFDEDGTFLATADGLPLFSIDDDAEILRVALAVAGEKALDFFQDDGDTIDQFHLTGVQNVMAFDAGEFELK